jgi:hypothetical protein
MEKYLLIGLSMVLRADHAPWNKLSRLSDEEMKALMIDVVNYCYDVLTTLCGPFGDTVVEHLKQHDLLPQWNDPERSGASTAGA